MYDVGKFDSKISSWEEKSKRRRRRGRSWMMKQTGDEEHGKHRPCSVVVTSNYQDVD
jgi:hypothetical protein